MDREVRPTRHLEIEGAYNVRDVGGYRTLDGRCTRWKTFLRADSLHRLPPASQRTIIDYGIRTVIDLRNDNTIRQAPSVFASSSDVVYHHQNMLVNVRLAEESESPVPEERSMRIRASYTRVLGLRQPQIRETLATLAAPGALPALVHCAAGSDRTGLITALVLGIAGVPAETIAEDYALSARFLLARYLAERLPGEPAPSDLTAETDILQSSPPEAMLGTLQCLEERYGGVEGYVRTIGLRRNQTASLRNAMVE
jgi:protein-tyrosine phosphatase